MIDKYIMDGHKLQWHGDRIKDWLDGKRIPPIHIDAGLSKGCNIHCIYCFGIMQGNLYNTKKVEYFPREPLLNYMKDAGEIGVKSIAIIGEAEPLLNPNVYDAIIIGSKAGIDMSLGTNGILLNKEDKGKESLKHLKWIRFNISAASEESYEEIHTSKQFKKVIESIKFCVKEKEKNNLDLTVGLQMVLIPENLKEIIPLAKLGKELGVDYTVIKQCSDSKENSLGIFERLNEYDNYTNILKTAEEESTDSYDVIIKWKKIMDKGKREYKSCYGTPFLLYSSGDGKLFPCGMFFEEKYWDKYLMGDLVKQRFTDIFKSDRYWEIANRVKKIDVNGCYTGCKTDAINYYLWKLKHPPKHINFI